MLKFTPNIQTSKLINNLKTASLGAYKKYSTYLNKYYWKPYFWSSRNYCLIPTKGESINVIKTYIQNQNKSIYNKEKT
ncbi:transposase [Borreliella afzelii]|uniref:transposase n=1 Tax=Borreliella afzelii TaxID=29518 RepID=UPI000AC94318